MNGFKGSAARLNDFDIAQVAGTMEVEVAALRAVLAVESAGDGFDKAGRPKALFERHLFYRLLKNKPTELAQAIAAGIAYPKWGEKPYPKGSDAVYKEIETAYNIAPKEALMATSWGLGQVLGSNHVAAGAESPEAMVEQAMASELYQLQHMANFIANNNLLKHVKSKDWASFAKGYNGPAYAKNKYDTKLQEAYNRFA